MKEMKKAKWAAVGISLLIAVSPPAKAQTATAAFTPKTGTDYVIRNVETGQFLRCSHVDINSAYFSSTIDSNYFLWQFSKPTSGDGWLLYNAGRGGYLNNEATSSTYRGKTDATGAAWYITTNTLNQNGYLISSSKFQQNTDATNCLYAYKSGGSYYLCSTEGEKVDLAEHKYGLNTKYYQLPTFQFYTYDQLYDLAVKCGYTGDKGDATNVEAWNTLATKIEEERQVTSDTVVSSYAGKGSNYVIASRRYHKFLYTDNKGGFHTADQITTSSVFLAQPTSEGVRVFTNLYHGDGKSFTLYYANNGHKRDFKLKDGDNGYLCVDNNRMVRFSTRSNNEDLALLDDEWVIAPSPYDSLLQYINVNKADIRDIEGEWYFRIENNKKRIKLIDANQHASKNVGGYLNDVDTTATALYDKNAGVGTSIHLADIFSNSINLRDAANVWRITLVAPGKEDNNLPIGIVSNFTHSLYYIQNANSGKFIGNPTSTTSQLMPLISASEDRKKRALFYFLPKDENNDKGEYALMLLDRDNSSTTETPKGWLDIADTDADGKPIDNDKQHDVPNMTQAGLIYRPVSATTTAADYAYDWSMHRARFIEARTAATATFDGYRYVSVWFPFDITNVDPTNMTLYTARWKSDYSGIVLKPLNAGEVLPAKHGALALITNNDKFQTVKFEIVSNGKDRYPANINNNILLGVAESEDYILGTVYNAATRTFCRDSIYVFSMTEKVTDKDDTPSYNDSTLGLGHPADPFLMANRCYIRATKDSERNLTNGKSKGLGISFDDNSTDGITDINTAPTRRRRYFDLQGREVSRPQHGIYITNGKKIFLR